MNEYMLIFRHQDGLKVASPEQLEQWMKQTRDWMNRVAAQNKLVGGNGLAFDEAKVVWHKGIVTDGPFGEIKETLGGYVIVKADSSAEAAEAAEMAKDFPVLQGDGNSIEVRRVAHGGEK